MKKLLVPLLTGIVCSLLTFGFVLADDLGTLVQASDGTLYLVRGGVKYTVEPDQVEDQALALIPDGGDAGDSAAPPAEEPPIVISLNGTANSDAFDLVGGDYQITWTSTQTSQILTCNNSYLYQVGSTYDLTAFGSRTGSGTTYVYDLDPGRYYLRSESTCGWQITLQHT